MKFLKFIGWTLLVLVVLSVLFVVITGIFDSFEDDLELITVKNSSLSLKNSTFSLLSFPLSSEIDQTELEQILSENDKFKEADFLVLQEVDESSNGFNQRTFFDQKFPDYNSWFSYTKKLLVSLFPLDKMRFKVYSGSMTLSKFTAASAVKRLLPIVVEQTFSLMTPKPSIQVIEFKTENNSELFIINLDNIKILRNTNSENDKFDFLTYIKDELIERLPKNAYIIITGNWHHVLPGIIDDQSDLEPIPMDWTKSDWQWIYDENQNNGYGMLISGNVTVKELEFFNKIEGTPFITKFTLD